MFVKSSVLWRCDHCGGAAWWTIIDSEAYYYCKAQCAGFTQLPLDLAGEECYLDKVVSVSGPESEAEALESNRLWDSRSESLPWE